MILDEERSYILGTARELYGRVVYSHKAHEKQREICCVSATRMRRINVALTSATTLLAIVSATLTARWALIATAFSAVATVGFVLWQGSFDPDKAESEQRIAAKELLWIREQLLMLITECHLPSISISHLQKCLEMINRELTAVYKFAPNTSPEAYALAKSSIKSGHFTFSEAEIDLLLPTVLRLQPGKLKAES